MANFFDQFDAKPAGNFFDQFDDPKQAIAQPRSAIGEIANQGYAGVVSDLPNMVGQAMQYSSDPGHAVYDYGKSLADWATKQGERPDLQANPEQHNVVTNALASGARMIPQSIAPAAAIGAGIAGIGAIAPAAAVSGLSGLAISSALGSLPAAMSQGQETLDKGLKAGISPDKAKEAARINALIEGGGETAGTYFGGKLFGLGAKAVGKAVGKGAEGGAGKALGEMTSPGVLKPWLKQIPETAAVEVGTEIGQNAGEAGVEKAYGIDTKSPYEAGKEAIAPTLGMTALLAPFGLAGFAGRAHGARNNAAILSDATADPKQREIVANDYFSQLKAVDPSAAQEFARNARVAISTNQPLALDNTVFNPAGPMSKSVDAGIQSGVVQQKQEEQTIAAAAAQAEQDQSYLKELKDSQKGQTNETTQNEQTTVQGSPAGLAGAVGGTGAVTTVPQSSAISVDAGWSEGGNAARSAPDVAPSQTIDQSPIVQPQSATQAVGAFQDIPTGAVTTDGTQAQEAKQAEARQPAQPGTDAGSGVAPNISQAAPNITGAAPNITLTTPPQPTPNGETYLAKKQDSAPSKQPASALQAPSIDLSTRNDKQLAYLSTNGQPGYKEAAIAEIARRAGGNVSTTAPATAGDSVSLPSGQGKETAPRLSVEDIAAEIHKQISANAVKNTSKKAAEDVRKGYITADEAEKRKNNAASDWASAKPSEHIARAAQAIADKNPIPLLNPLVGAYSTNQGTAKAFESITGVRLSGNAESRTKAIFDWAGWSEAQVADHVKQKRAAAAERDKAREQKEKDRHKESVTSEVERKGYRTEDGAVISAKDVIEGRIADGYTELSERKQGAAKVWWLTKPGSNSGFKIRNKSEADYAAIKIEELASAQRKETPAATPKPTLEERKAAALERSKAKKAETKAAEAPASQSATDDQSTIKKAEAESAVDRSKAAPVQDQNFYYTNGDMGMKSNGAFTAEKRHWMTFSLIDALRLDANNTKPYGATRQGVFTGTVSGESVKQPKKLADETSKPTAEGGKPTDEPGLLKIKEPEVQAFEARTLSNLRDENGTQGVWIGDLMKDGVAYPVRMNFKRENRADWWADIYDGGKVNTSIPFGWIKGSITVNDAIDAVLRYVKEDKSASWSFANAGKKHGALLEKKAAAKQRSESAKVSSYDKQIASIGGKPGADWAETDRRLASELESLESIRYKTGANEQLISILKGRIASDPSKFQAGYGVGWRVTRDQINRGYRIVSVSNVEKTATIRQVADTGLTTSGGNNDRMQDAEVYVSDLIRDRRYDRPSVAENKQTSAPAKAQESKGGADDTRFNQAGQATITPSDSAIYDMAAEGKSAQEILDFIGATSRRPFERYLARALKSLGVSSSVKLDSQGGWMFNRGGKKYAAAYNPRTDSVALFTPREATRHILHELVHAATLKAIAKGGRAALEMKRLFEHLKAEGSINGMYGMANIEEFVAEAFSNPKFQQALKAIAAPKGPRLQSAWDWFVGMVSRIMGIKSPAQVTALDRAMVLGAELMRENAALNSNVNSDANRYAIAHHGTPHVFAPEPGFPHGRFRLDKMGTGEGAQAYGWGVYLAENKDVSDAYRKAGIRSTPIQYNGKSIIDIPRDEFSTLPEITRKALIWLKDNSSIDGATNNAKMSGVDGLAKEIARLSDAGMLNELPGGNLYRLDIPDDVMPKMLDWDKPLSEQSEGVRKALEASGVVNFTENTGPSSSGEVRNLGWTRNVGSLTGDQLYRRLIEKEFTGKQTTSSARKKSEQAASEFLSSIGIPGLRYLDGNSRTDGAGSHNYVIWDQKTLDRIALLERNGEALDDLRFNQADDGNVSGNVSGNISDTITIDGVERPRLKKPWQMTRAEYDAAAPTKAKKVFYEKVGTIPVEIVRNPTSNDIAAMKSESRREFPNATAGDAMLRRTEDPDGNSYYWKAHLAVHQQIEPLISDRDGVAVNQNAAQRLSHRGVVRKALYDGEKVPVEILGEYPGLLSEVQSIPGNKIEANDYKDKSATSNQEFSPDNPDIRYNVESDEDANKGASYKSGSVSTYSLPETLAKSLHAASPNASAFVAKSGEAILLSELVIPKEERGAGSGSAFMAELARYAEENGMDIVLTADGDYGGSKIGQQRFYRRHGFVPNTGRNKDFRYRENMIRRPADGIRYNVAADFIRTSPQVQQIVANAFASDSSTSWITPFNTQFHKAQKWAAEGKPWFKKVFDLGQQFLSDVSRFAVMAQSQAPNLFHEIKGARGVVDAIKGVRSIDDITGKTRTMDAEAIASPLYEGTLHGGGSPMNGRVFSDAELRAKYKLSDKQIGLYREALAAVNVSLDEMAKSIIAKHAKNEGLGFDNALSVNTMAEEIIKSLEQKKSDIGQKALEQTQELLKKMDEAGSQQKMQTIVDAAEKASERIASTIKDVRGIVATNSSLQKHGYFPLMRFGKNTVTAMDEDGKVQFFGMYEGVPLVPKSGQYQANRIAAEIRAENPTWTVETGIHDTEKYKLYQGLNLEAVQLFAAHMDQESKEPFQEFLRVATNDRSVQNRLIHRKGTPGFDRDVRRTLAQFITSNARHTSSNYHLFDMGKAASEVPQKHGDISGEAVRLHKYISEPMEEAQKLRGFMFFNYLGGSIASAAVNMTQIPAMTFPFLSKYESVGALGKRLALAAKLSMNDPKDVTGKVGEALRRAEMDGVTAPQEIHQLMATASNNIFAGSQGVNLFMSGWGKMFAMAETFNRRTTFIAAYQIADRMTPKQLAETGSKDAFQFAENAVKETQGIYNKGNRPNVGRGAVGATLMTFKQYSIMYLELLKRLPRKQQLIMMGVLMLSAGAGGLPFAEDIEDIIDTFGQWLGFATNTSRTIRKAASSVLGAKGADIALNGLFSQIGIDVHSRLGMQNLLPGTGILKQSSVNKGRDVEEFFGPAGSLIASVGSALENLATGHAGKAALDVSPTALQNAFKGANMAATGYGEDSKGKRTVPVNMAESVAKGVGFNPKSIADFGGIKRELSQDTRLLQVKRENFSSALVDAILSGDTEARQEVMAEIRKWNENNPSMRVVINPGAIANRVRSAKTEGVDRFLKTTPRTMRGEAATELR